MLYIIRHGQTDWNLNHKLQGGIDIPLNDNGRQMARDAKADVDAVQIDICYSSPMKRAAETAEILLENRDIPILYDDRLREMSFGVCEGVTGYFDGSGSAIDTFFNNPAEYVAVEGGESVQELYARTWDFYTEIVKPQLEEGKNILIVGHGAMNCSLICQIKGIELENFWSVMTGNCQLIEIDS